MATKLEKQTPFATVEQAIEDIRQGKFVVVVDAADRENEGDLTIAAQFATPEAINFMATHGRGLICLCLTEERCDELGLQPMTERNETPFGTAFTVSIEAREGIATGISAHDRSRTIQIAIDRSKGADGQAPRRTRQGRRRRSPGLARPCPLRVLDGRRLPLAPLRLWRAARAGAAAARARGSRRSALHGPGGPRNRAAQQAEGVRASGERARHRRGKPRARLPGGREGLGHRQPDPRRPRADHDPDPHEQSEEDQRARGLRPHSRRAGADRGAAQRREPPPPRREAGQACAQAAPPVSPLRRAGARRVTEERWPGEDRISTTEEKEHGEDEADASSREEDLAEAESEPAPPEEQLDDEGAEERRDGDTPVPEEAPAEEDELPRLRAAGHAPG